MAATDRSNSWPPQTGHAGRASLPLPTNRITVPTPRPTSRAIRRMSMPRERNFNPAFTLAPWLCSTVRRPSCFPSALARANPAITRSRIIARSNSAKTPSIWNMARPDGVDVSSPCSRTNRPLWHGGPSRSPTGRLGTDQAYPRTKPPPCRSRAAQQRSSDGQSRDVCLDPWHLRHLCPHR